MSKELEAVRDACDETARRFALFSTKSDGVDQMIHLQIEIAFEIMSDELRKAIQERDRAKP